MKKFYDASLMSLSDASGKLNIFALAVPIFFQQIFTLLLSTVNTVALMQVSGDAVTAINVASSVLFIPTAILTMPATGILIILCIALGLGEADTVSNAYVSGMRCLFAASAVISVICVAFAMPFMELMNISGTVLDYAVIYFKIRSVFLVLDALIVYLTAVLRAHGRAESTLVSGIIVNAVNALLSVMVVKNIIFSDNKIIGVSVAAVIGQLAGVCYSFGTLYGSKCIKRGGSFKTEIAVKIFKIGIPGGFSILAYNISTMLVTAMVATLGTEMVNTSVFVTNISNYTYKFGYAMAQAGGIMMGRLYGAGNCSKAKSLFAQNIRCIPIINAMLSIAVFVFSNKIMMIFTDNANIIGFSHYLFLASVPVQIFRGMTHVGENALCSAEDTVYTSIVSISSCFLINVLLCWIFCIKLGFGLYGYYIASAVDEGMRGLMYRIRWNKGKPLQKFER